ncbi:MAG: hypothetical protein AB9921_00630 [Erysipelotrichaceae bacterium]
MNKLNSQEKVLLGICTLILFFSLSTMKLYEKSILIILCGINLILLLVVIFSYLLRKDEENRIFYIAALLVISSPIAIYVIVLIIYQIDFMLLTVGDAKTWIGFSGSIIGGAMTLFAVVFTINHDKSAREKEIIRSEKLLVDEKAQRLMPVIEIYPLRENDELFSKKMHGEDGLSFIFVISNLSENHAREINIQAVEYIAYYGRAKKIDLSNELFSKPKSIKLLASMRKSEFHIGLSSYKLDKLFPKVFNQTEIRIEITIKVTLYDIHKIAQHTFITKVNGSLHENFNDPISYYFGDNGEKDLELYNKFDLHAYSYITDIA